MKQFKTFAILFLSWSATQAQFLAEPSSKYHSKFDSLYVADFTHILTTRVYLSTKFNQMELTDSKNNVSVVYRPNNQTNIGVGFSYRAFTLNLGFGLKALNQDDDIYGDTRYFDAQSNIYMKKVATNLFFQTYQGYYIDSHSREQLGWEPDSIKKPTRPDIRQFNLGLSSVFIFNNDKFSYRAAFTHDAWQKKSAGSFLLGGYGTYFTVRADSSMIPAALDTAFEATLQIKQGNFLDFGLMGGYAHSFVIAKHVFFTLSTVGGAGVSIVNNRLEVREGEVDDRQKTGFGYVFQARAALGWNSARNYVGLSYNNESSWSAQSENDRFGWSVGNFRFNYVHRFNRRVVPLDKIFDGLVNLVSKNKGKYD